jgi:hypothetical protein
MRPRCALTARDVASLIQLEGEEETLRKQLLSTEEERKRLKREKEELQRDSEKLQNIEKLYVFSFFGLHEAAAAEQSLTWLANQILAELHGAPGQACCLPGGEGSRSSCHGPCGRAARGSFIVHRCVRVPPTHMVPRSDTRISVHLPQRTHRC